MSEITLWCQLEGTHHSFPIVVPSGANVHNLKVLVKADRTNALKGIDAADLTIWKISLPDAEARGLTSANMNDTAQPLPRDLVETYWADRVDSGVHVFVADPQASPASPPIASSKRVRDQDPLGSTKRIRLEFAQAPRLTPPSIAEPSTFDDYWKTHGEPQMRCGRPRINRSTFPVVLAHPVFARFLSDSKSYQPTSEDLKFVAELSSNMCQFFDDEDSRAVNFRAVLGDYGIDLVQLRIEGTKFVTDGSMLTKGFIYCNTEAKKDFGAAKADPYIQSGAYHLACAQQVAARTRRPLPCLHIFYAGPVLGFAGSIFTDNFDMNVLGPMLPLFWHPTDDDMQRLAASMFGAFKKAVSDLREEYNRPEPDPPKDTRFPYITHYQSLKDPSARHDFRYIEQLEPGKLLYVCQHIKDETLVVVKFVRRYSKEAHDFCAKGGGAPTLHGFDSLPCGWFLVVMELLDPKDWKAAVDIGPDEAAVVRDAVKVHVDALHTEGYVHGDIRRPNVLVKRDSGGRSVRLVDFDWAGVEGKARYHHFVNPDLGGFERPGGVVGGAEITKKHDLAMVDLLLRPIIMRSATM